MSSWRRPARKTLLKSLDISIATAYLAPNLLKTPSNSIRCNCEKIYSWLGSFSWTETILEIRKQATLLEVISKPIRLDLKNCLFTVTRPWVWKQGRWVGIFVYFGEVQSRSQGRKFVCREKQLLSATIIIIVIRLWLITQRGMRFN